MWRTLLIAGVVLTIGQTLAPASAAPLTAPPSSSIATIATIAPAPRHLALVIGNADYVDRPLASASRDADDMSAALDSLGFDVTRRTNLDEAAMRQALDAFAARLGPNDTALVYFAGHGLQAGGDARLVPLDARERRPATLVRDTISAQDIVERITRARPGSANIVVLDMCLSDPFERTHARTLTLPPRTLVAYAAAPGEAASEDERNGRYTAALLRALGARSSVTSTAFVTAASDVARASSGAQRPWIASTLDRGFTIADAAANVPNVPSEHWADANANSPADSANAVRTRGILPKDSNEQYELTFWESIKDSTFPSDYEAYLKAYPNGRFAALAKARIERLRAAGNAKPAASAPPAATAAPAAPSPKPPPSAPATAAAPEKPRPVIPPAPAAAAAVAPPAAITTKPAAKTASGSEIKDCPACPVLIPLAAGSFTMGSNNDDPAEKPPHRVSVGRAFAIGKYEVTVEQWNACADAGACTRVAPEGESTPAPGNAPMRNVSWDDAQVYVKWLSKVGGKPYRLPTEAEWEYAARGGTQSTYWWGDQMKKGTADCKDCGDPYKPEAPAPVGSFAPNPYGLYDMNGSVWEWVADCWHGSYKNAPADGRAWDDPSCSVRVIRGGSWREGAAYMQSATRFKYSSSVRQSQNGFRVARDME
ncbi:SUMF1/EgtB/PvdO family nonheme iron enzyme [Caballeronia glebae]|uniref:SUMF1/EgtB/PvdO family nonheme iron enzyme n=1 Tax=Caballeronia glebae TaxID=1777143 RepID=UPI0038BD63F3